MKEDPMSRPSEILKAKLPQVREIIARYPVRNPRLFGSVARGDDKEGSDLDLLVDPMEHTSYFDLAGLQLELEALLGMKVDVVTPGGLSPRLSARVMADLKPIQAF